MGAIADLFKIEADAWPAVVPKIQEAGLVVTLVESKSEVSFYYRCLMGSVSMGLTY